MKRFLSYFLLLTILVPGCNPDETIRVKDEEFFPLKNGFFQIYAVEEILYSSFNPPEELTYELKAEIVDSFTNGEGGTTYVIHRSTRNNPDKPWSFMETWSARRTNQYAIETEGNTSYIKLVFPLQSGARWNGNLLNALGEDEYEIQSMGSSFETGNGISFSNCTVVNQNNESNLVFKDERMEVYSPGLGLVFRESKVWSYNCSGGTCSGQINSGRYLKQVLKEHGQN